MWASNTDHINSFVAFVVFGHPLDNDLILFFFFSLYLACLLSLSRHLSTYSSSSSSEILPGFQTSLASALFSWNIFCFAIGLFRSRSLTSVPLHFSMGSFLPSDCMFCSRCSFSGHFAKDCHNHCRQCHEFMKPNHFSICKHASTCHQCGEKGHLKRNCLPKKAET